MIPAMHSMQNKKAKYGVCPVVSKSTAKVHMPIPGMLCNLG